MILTPTRLAAATDGFRAVFLRAFDGEQPDWHDFAMEVPSNAGTETYYFITGIPGMKELVGEAKLEYLANAGYDIKNKEWESTVQVRRADIERDALGLIRPKMAELGTVAANHPRTLLAALLNSSFTALDYTGTAFFSSAAKPYDLDDKSKGARTFTNKGTAALSAASFVVARTKLKKVTDSKGNNLGLGRKLTLIVPPELEEVAKKLQTGENISVAGGSTETNTLRNSFEVKVINELSSATAWFLVESGREIKPFIVQMEVKPEFIAADDPKSTHVLLQKKFLYQAYYRGNAGYAMSQLAYGSEGTT